MQNDLLPPEEDQRTQEEQDLERQFNEPAIEDFRRNNAGPSRTQQAQQAASFVKKNKKWFYGAGGGLAIIIPIAMFFAWMMLFKNVHIKNLYVTYRWAQFNRGLNKAVKAQLEYAKANPETAKPTGSADGTVSATDAPDKISADTNENAGPDAIDPDDPAKVEAEAKKVSSVEQSLEGASEKPLTDAGTNRSVPAAEGTGDTPDAKAKSAQEKAKANLDEELKGKPLEADVPDSIKDGVDKAKAQEDAGMSPREAAVAGADEVMNSSGWKGALQKAGGVFNIATFYCIFHDIYGSAKDEVVKIALDGAMGASQMLNKTADCQKQGKCDANQIGAVVDKFDNNDKSFSESCGYHRATQESTASCEEIDPQFVVNGLATVAGGNAKNTILTADALLDPPFEAKLGPAKLSVDSACDIVNAPVTQFVAGAVNIGLLVTSGGGWAAAGKAAGQGAIVFAGTAGGKALIASTIMKYSDNLYKFLDPYDMGNLMDMGNMATASATCAVGFCPLATPAQIGQMDREYRAERIAANSKRSVLEKFFDTENPDSVSSRVALNAPVTPSAVVGRLKNVFAAISNPVRLNTALGRNTLAIAKPSTAYADAEGDTGASVYGLTNAVAMPAVLFSDSSDYPTVLKWAEGRNMDSIAEALKKCGGEGSESYAKTVSKGDKTCQWDSMNADQKMFMQYKYHQNVAYKRGLANNKQSNAKSGGSSSSGGTGSTETVSTSGLVGKATKGQPCPTGTTSAGDAKSFKGVEMSLCNVNGITVNVSIAANLKNMIAAAKTAGVTLTGSSFRSYERQIELRIAHGCPDPNTPSRNCSPPTARPGTSRHEEGLAIDFQSYSFSWLATNAANYGFFNLPSESWHWSVDGS